jgi:hypothetical protein
VDVNAGEVTPHNQPHAAAHPSAGTINSRHARRTGEFCGHCGIPFATTETRWRVPVKRIVAPSVIRRQLTVCCSRCTPDWRKRDRPVQPCEYCSRPTGTLPGRRTFCSDRCAWSWHNAQRSARRAATRHAAVKCHGCGSPFIPARSDATTCCHACRQRVYRRRSLTQACDSEVAASNARSHPSKARRSTRVEGEPVQRDRALGEQAFRFPTVGKDATTASACKPNSTFVTAP